MDDVAFTTAYNTWQKSIPFTPETVDDHNRLRQEMAAAAQPEHVLTFIDDWFDGGSCTCGWTSNKFDDGRDLVEREWRDHVMQVIEGDFLSA